MKYLKRIFETININEYDLLEFTDIGYEYEVRESELNIIKIDDLDHTNLSIYDYKGLKFGKISLKLDSREEFLSITDNTKESLFSIYIDDNKENIDVANDTFITESGKEVVDIILEVVNRIRIMNKKDKANIIVDSKIISIIDPNTFHRVLKLVLIINIKFE